MSENQTPLLQMEGIHKSFFGVKVLDDVPLTLNGGEVLALLGENGAGKSTLIKILNGDYQKDAGTIRINGEVVEFAQPRDAEEHGIRMIYQELHYAADLSVMENLLIGHLPRRRGLFSGMVDWQAARRISSEYLQLLNIDIDPATLMRDLAVVERQIVEIVKAISKQARIIVMDEPTAALTPPEVDMLFGIIQNLRDQGVGIIYISHRLDEIFDVAQRVMVLRDGKHVATRSIEEVTHNDVVNFMVGHALEERVIEQKSNQSNEAAPALEVANLTKHGVFNDVSFSVYPGEIVGIFGLLGSGQVSLTRTIFGAEKVDEGVVRVNGVAADIRRPRDGQRAGIGFVPIDRKVRGLVLGMSVRKNITLSNWGKLATVGFFRQGVEKQHTQTWVDNLGIRMAGDMEVPVRFLSGGNQQKVVLSRWLEANVKVLILNEPTWGVDVGARSDIYNQLEELAEQGLAILMVSSDIQEVLSVCHRILTIYRGKLTGEFSHDEADQETLLNAASGSLV